MVLKTIPHMGQIEFDEFYTKKNIRIIDMNMSPIKDCEFNKILSKIDVEELINNDYIFSLLKAREKYYLYQCNPKMLLSHYRYDIYIKYLYVKSYIENKNYDMAKSIYLSHIEAFNNFFEPDGTKNNFNDFINNFNDLINSIKENGFINSVIPISKTGIPIDGSHRLAICLYLNLKVSFVVFDLLDAKYDADFFERRGVCHEYIELINDVINKNGWIL